MATSLYRVAAAVFGAPLEEMSAETSPETLEGWDSLNHLQLIMALESEFAVSLSMSEAAELDSLGRILDSLSARDAAPSNRELQ